MRRLIALLSLLATSSFSMADERTFEEALSEWEGLCRPLATARGAALIQVADEAAREAARDSLWILDERTRKGS